VPGCEVADSDTSIVLKQAIVTCSHLKLGLIFLFFHYNFVKRCLFATKFRTLVLG